MTMAVLLFAVIFAFGCDKWEPAAEMRKALNKEQEARNKPVNPTEQRDDIAQYFERYGTDSAGPCIRAHNIAWQPGPITESDRDDLRYATRVCIAELRGMARDILKARR